MTNSEVATALEQVADLLEFQGANPFRIRAYRNGARAIRDLPQQITTLLADPAVQLTNLRGIGNDLAQKITEFVQTGRFAMLDELLESIPASVLTLLRVPGLGPKKAAALYNQLGIETLDQLREACVQGQIRKLKGFAETTEQAILSGLDLAVQADQRIYWAEADGIVQDLLAHMKSSSSIRQIEVAGSFRRGRETVGDLDLLVEAARPQTVMNRFGAYPDVDCVLARGDTKMSVRWDGRLQIDLRVVPHDAFGAALQYFTGSKDHNVVLRGRARQRGLKINEWGVFQVHEGRPDKWIAGKTEADVYAVLELPWFPPELREARDEFHWAETHTLPDLIRSDAIQGDLHMHTTASDGRASLQEMVDAAKARGLKYIAITDHSKRVSMAHGLDGDRLRSQWKDIDQCNRRVTGIKVLKGVECDILEKGGMDLPDDVLSEADWVIASVHYGQNQSRDQITKRIIGALRNPHVSIVAHPSGRLINRRAPYELDMDAVINVARQEGKFLELNANPARLDLDDTTCAAARQAGVPIVISTDAHHPDGLDAMRYGIQQARRGGLTADDVANTRSWSALQKLLRRK